MSQNVYEKFRAFIVTPFEKKKDAEGNVIDFDEVSKQLILPALDRLGIRGRTTGEIVRAGNIHADMFQRLLTADLVVAEISIHNANVFYELGIRHALRQRHTVMLRGEDKEGKKADKPIFDLQGFRYLKYDRDDPAAHVDALVETIRATLDVPDQDSPVFRSLPGLREQERSHFLPVPIDFREEVERALAEKQRGDLALRALETNGFQWGIEGLRVVARAQFNLPDWEGARASWEEVLETYRDDKEANTRLGTVYQKLGDLTRSDQALNRVLGSQETTPEEKAEAYSLQASNAKRRWIKEWRQYPAEQQREEALRSGFLRQSFELYEKGFAEDLNHFYPGLNALAMLTVTIELAKQHGAVWAETFDKPAQAKAALAERVKQRAELAPAVLLSIKAGIKRLQWELDNAKDPATREKRLDKLTWAKISEADHVCLTSTSADKVKRGYRDCLKDVADFYGGVTADQLLIYQGLGILEKTASAGLEVARPTAQPPAAEQPHVLVFTGHRIDDETREKSGRGKRFPKEMEQVARDAIREAIVKELGEGDTNAVGIAGGASGGDILFHEVCAELGIETRLYLAVPREAYIKASVFDAGPEWVRRFNNLHDTLERRVLSQSKELPRWLREKGKEYNIWQRSNLWILTNAIALDRKGGGSNLTLIALWNGKAGDGAGGTEDMIQQAEKRGAQTVILPTERLFGLAG